jgi:O-antigen ligase
LILLWIGSGYLSALFSGLHNSEWLSAFDILRYGSILWFLRRSGYGELVLKRMLFALASGTLVGLAWGYYGVRVTGERFFLGLNSVGHVNHSAIYVAIIFGATIAWLRAAWSSENAQIRALGTVTCATFGYSLVLMESRATVGVGFVVGSLILGVYAIRSGKNLWPVILITILLAAALFAAQPEVVKKNAVRLHENIFLGHRDAIWRSGIVAWKQFPFFGVGMGNYGRIDFNRLEAWSSEQGAEFDRANLRPTSHAHSLYVNTLAERGIAGFAVLIAVLAVWGWTLARNLPTRSATIMLWAYWGGAFSAWLVTILVGTVNTTLHHEHALACMLLLGGWQAIRRCVPSTGKTIRP